MGETTRRQFLIGSGMGVAVAALPETLCAENPDHIVAANLLCEHQRNPLGIDIAAPRLSWQIMATDASSRDQRQTAYQVLVASTPELLARHVGDLWDSGKIVSSESVLVSHAGKPLQSFARVCWKVRLWDQQGHASSWSEQATIETAIVESGPWKAQWIEAPVAFLKQYEPQIQSSIPLGKWIWPVSQSRVYLRKFFDLPPAKQLVRAVMQAHCENEFHTFLNGQAVALAACTEANGGCAAEVTTLLQKEHNFWGVKAYQSNDPYRFSAAFRAGLQLEFSDGTKQYVLSDESWEYGTMGSYFQNADPQDWQANRSVGSWGGGPISVEIHPRLLRHSLYLRRDFSLRSPVRSARLYATARGLYDLRLNGKPVGNARLAPGCVEKVQYYQTYDVTRALRDGSNVLAATTGSGWLNSRYYGDMFAHQTQFLASLRVELADGSIVEEGTGPEWKLQLSALTDNDLQWGERYDARKELPGWDMPGYDDSAWMRVAVTSPPDLLPLHAQPYEDIRVTEEQKAIHITSAEGVYIFDFGRNRSGRGRLMLTNTKPGQLVIIKYGERLNGDGLVQDDVYSDVFYPVDNDWQTGKARFMTRNLDTYVCRGEDREIYEPRFAYTGFRYGQLSSWSGAVDKDTFTQVVFHTDYAETGTFTCANQEVNDIGAAIVLAMQDNHHSGPTDCPTREKNFWNGDSNVFCETACWYGDVSRLYSEWTINGRKVPSRDVAWVDEIITLPWMMYMFYGDKRPAAEAYPQMADLVNGRLTRSENGLYTGRGETAIGDHVSLDPTPLPFFIAAIHSQSLQRIAQIAAMLGKRSDAERYQAAAATAAAAFNRAFFTANGDLSVSATQSSTVMPLAFGLPTPEHRGSVAQALIASVRKHDYHPTTGFVCTPFLLPALTEYGSVDDAWRMITQRTEPSWGFMLKSGSTTITETWEAETAAIGTGTSMDHFALGSVGCWFFEYLGGFRLDFSRPAFQSLLIKPYLPSQLASASVHFDSVRGPLTSEWKKNGTEVTWQVSIPPNTHAELLIPCADPTLLKEGVRRKSVRSQPTADRDRVKVEIGSGSFTYFWSI
jgi:alpha-L-rhamnosidase